MKRGNNPPKPDFPQQDKSNLHPVRHVCGMQTATGAEFLLEVDSKFALSLHDSGPKGCEEKKE